MFGLHELFESTLAERLASENLEKLTLDELADIDQESMQSCIDDTAGLLLGEVKKQARKALPAHQRTRKGFEHRLRQEWRRPLDLLDLFICLAVDAGTEFNGRFRNQSDERDNAILEALTRLHARACQVSGEVLALLSAGFADGAQARWRSLHELAVVASLIEENEQELAERYLSHELIDKHQLARAYQEHYEPLGLEPLLEGEFEELEAACDGLVEVYGKEFKEDYGWAAKINGGKSPSLTDLEGLAHLSHMRPYYRWASKNVHPSSYGAFFRLGVHETQEDTMLLAGPSNYGLADPGGDTAISLLHITSSLLITKPLLDCLVTAKVLERVAYEVGEAFVEAQEALEASAFEGA